MKNVRCNDSYSMLKISNQREDNRPSGHTISCVQKNLERYLHGLGTYVAGQRQVSRQLHSSTHTTSLRPWTLDISSVYDFTNCLGYPHWYIPVYPERPGITARCWYSLFRSPEKPEQACFCTQSCCFLRHHQMLSARGGNKELHRVRCSQTYLVMQFILWFSHSHN